MGVFADKEYKIVLEKNSPILRKKSYTIETPDNPPCTAGRGTGEGGKYIIPVPRVQKV